MNIMEKKIMEDNKKQDIYIDVDVTKTLLNIENILRKTIHGFRQECPDCGCLEGELHAQEGCDIERCPFCGTQLLNCVGFNKECPSKKLFNQTLPEQERNIQYKKLCNEKGRVPFMSLPNICQRCGEVHVEIFMVNDWEEVVHTTRRKIMLCHECYEQHKEWIKENK